MYFSEENLHPVAESSGLRQSWVYQESLRKSLHRIRTSEIQAHGAAAEPAKDPWHRTPPFGLIRVRRSCP